MPRNYRDDRHPEEASTCRKESARVFPGNRADVPERRGEVRLLSADCETGSYRGLAPLSASAGARLRFSQLFFWSLLFPATVSARFLLRMVGKDHLARDFAGNMQRSRQQRFHLGALVLGNKEKHPVRRTPLARQVLIVEKNVWGIRICRSPPHGSRIPIDQFDRPAQIEQQRGSKRLIAVNHHLVRRPK